MGHPILKVQGTICVTQNRALICQLLDFFLVAPQINFQVVPYSVWKSNIIITILAD